MLRKQGKVKEGLYPGVGGLITGILFCLQVHKPISRGCGLVTGILQ